MISACGYIRRLIFLYFFRHFSHMKIQAGYVII